LKILAFEKHWAQVRVRIRDFNFFYTNPGVLDLDFKANRIVTSLVNSLKIFENRFMKSRRVFEGLPPKICICLQKFTFET
jgi:hypothetical protein